MKKSRKVKESKSMYCFKQVLLLLGYYLKKHEKMSRSEIIQKIDYCLTHLKLLNMDHIKRGIDKGKFIYDLHKKSEVE